MFIIHKNNNFITGDIMTGVAGEIVSTRLSDAERVDFAEVVESSMHVQTREEFFKWTQSELQRIFPHGMLICGVGRLGKDVVQIQNVIGCNFPDEYVDALRRPDGLTQSPIIRRWLKEQQPILFEPECEMTKKLAPPGWLENFHHYGLSNLAAHGLRDADSHTASYFSFSRIPGPLNQRHAYLLKLLVPHLHSLLTRVLSSQRFNGKQSQTQAVSLSTREAEVLKWMSCGKSNWEIAQVMGLSESTVKNHVHRILGKLQVGTRVQAVAKAISLKQISAKH